MAEVVLGLAELLEKLGKLERVAQRKVLIEAARAGAQIASDELSRAAPRDTGLLAASIKLRVKTGSSDANEGTVEVRPGKAFYWFFTNTGTKFLAGTHWADRAIESASERITEAMKDVLISEVEKAVT